MISSLHYDAAIDQKTLDDRKPEIITFYNDTKSGVDVVDKMCATYNVARNTRRWPMVVFFAMLNVSGINSLVIYLRNENTCKSRKVFLKELAKELVADELNRRSAKSRGIPRSLQKKLQKTNCSKTQDDVPSTSSNKRKRCLQCSSNKKTRLSKYFCKQCNECLCLEHAVMICDQCYQSKLSNEESDED